MINKPNDWIAANINAPEGTTLLDMRASGILPENTIIREKDYYKDIPQVQNYFQKDGKFDETGFNEFYDSALREFDTYSNDDFVENLISQMDRSPYDWTKLDNPNVIDTSAYISNIKDKNRTTMGTGNIWQIGDPVYSDREVAQANNVRDEFGRELDWTANDKGGLIKGLFMPTMALASWDEDGTHIENGVEVEHKKGELKLDWKGDPYMEKLGDREGYGKDIVKWSDVLTKEGTFLNKIDPFDSDGLEKSIGGTIAKTALKIAPYFIPGVGPYLGYAIASKELLSVMPTILKAANGIIGDSDNLFGKKMNQWENFMEKYSSSMSDHGKSNFWNFENVGDIISSSFGQLASQRAIAEIPKKLAKNTVRASKTGQALALSYMAMTSAKDSYSSFIEAGADDWVAGLGMFGTMGMYYGLMNVGYFKDWIFRDSWLSDDVEFKKSFGKWINEYAKSLGIEHKTMSPRAKKILGNKIINTIYTKGSDMWKKFAESKIGEGVINGVMHSGLNEGIEEVTEEMASDLVKALAKGLEAMGMKVTKDPTQKLDFGFSPEDIMQRYAASFVGGFVGGTVFKGYEFYENFQSGQMNISDIEDLDKRIAWYIRNGYYDKMQSILDKKLKKGELPADINKSFSQFADVESMDANPDFTKRVYLPTQDPKQNHQQYLHDVLSSQLRVVNDVLHEHIIPISDEEVIKRVTDRIALEASNHNLSVEEYSEKYLINSEIEMMKELGYLNMVARDANTLAAKVYEAGHNLRIAKAKLEKAQSGEKAKVTKEVKEWEEILAKHVKAYEEILDGKRDAKYIAHAYYRANNELLSAYLQDDHEFKSSSDFFPETDIRHYVRLKYDLDFDSLEESVQKHLTGEFNMYLQNKAADWEHRIGVMSDLHYTLSERLAKTIQGISDRYKGYKTDNSFESTYEPSYWHKFKDIAEKYDSDPEQFEKEALFLSQYKDRTFESLSEDEVKDLAEYISVGANPVDPTNTDIMKDALSTVQEQLHLIENFDTYLKLSDVLGEGKVSVDQLLTQEGFTKWGEIFGMEVNDDASRRIQKKLILDYYTQMKSEKIVSSNESRMYKAYAINILKTAMPIMEAMIKSYALEDFPGMSKYDYSVDPDPYLSLMNSALGELKDAIITANSQKIDDAINKLRKIASNDGVFSEEDVENNEWGEPLPDFNIDGYIQSVLAPIKDLIQFAKEIEAIKSDIVESPINEFLNSLSLDVNGKPLKILEVISNVENTLKLIDRIEDLELGSDTMAELYAAQNLLKIAASLLGTAYKDPRLGASLNDRINLFREGEKLASIDNHILGQELVRIANKVDTIINLVEQNVVGTVEEQKKIAANVFPKLIKSIVNPSIDDEDEKLFTKTLKDVLGIEENILQKLWIEAGGISLDGVSIENYKEFEQTVRKWQKLVYDTLTPKLIEKFGSNVENVWEKIGQELGKKLGDGLGNMRSTHMSSQTDNISLYDSVIFFLTTISSDPTEFWSKYKTVVDKEGEKEQSFLPYFSQELAVQIGYARTKNNSLFNGFISQLKKTGAKDDDYIKGISPLWNFMMIDGSAGSGKSTGFSYFLSEILKLDGYTIVATSHLSDRAESLAKTLDSKHITTETIIDKIIKSKTPTDSKKKNIYVEDFDPKTQKGSTHIKLSDDYEIVTEISEELKTIFGEDLSKAVLFIDEVTLLHSGKLRVLSDFAKATGLTLIALGDTKQESATFNGITHSIEDFIFVKAPKLQASLRITNKAKKKNRLIIENILNEIDDYYSRYPHLSDSELDGHLEEILTSKSTELLTLSYTMNSSGLFGEMYSESPEEHIDFLLKTTDKDDKIGIIVDSKSKDKYSKWAEDKRVEIIDASKVQGEQYKYTIVDITWGGDVKHALLKKFNTLTSRSKVGTIIKYSENNDIREIFSPGKQVFGSTASDTGHLSLQDPNSEENKAIRSEYKEFRNDCLSDIIPFKPAEKSSTEEPISTSSSNPVSSSGSNPSGTLPGSTPSVEGPKKSEMPKFDDAKMLLERNKEYQERQNILNSDKQNVVSEDQFYDLIQKSEGKFLFDLMNISKILPQKADVENEKKLKRFIQIVSGFVLNTHVDPEVKITDEFKQLLREFDPTNDWKLSDSFLNAFANKTGYYYFAPSGNKSVIHYCIDTDSLGTIVIPIGETSKKLAGAWKDINVTLQQGTISVSSNGAIHTNIKETIGDRFLYGSSRSMEFGVYAATSESNSDHDFKSGKAFLPLFLPHQYTSGKTFFVPVKKDGKSWNTQDLGWSIPIKKPGVQRILAFENLFSAWITLNDLLHHLSDVVDESKMKKYKEELGPIFSGADFLNIKPKTNGSTAVMPRSLVHSSRVGQLFTAIFRAFYSENFTQSEKLKFIESVLKWTGDKNSFEISIKTEDGHKPVKHLVLDGQNIKIISIKDSNDPKNPNTISLSKATYNIDELLKLLFGDDPDIIKKLSEDEIRITPVRKDSKGNSRVVYDYTLFPDIIENNKNLVNKISEFLKKDSYFKHNIYLNIYADSDFTSSEKIWKIVSPKIDDEFVWDIIYVGLPIYSMNSEQKGEILNEDNSRIVKLEIDSMWTPAAVDGTEESHLEIKSGTSFVNKGNGWFGIQVGKSNGFVNANSGWAKEFLNESDTVKILEFSNTQVRIETESGTIKTVDFNNFGDILRSNGVQEYNVTADDQIKINDNVWTIKYGDSTRVNLEFGNSELSGEIIGVDGTKAILLIKTPSGYIIEKVKKPNIESLEQISQIKFIGGDNEYMYYIHNNKYFGRKIENIFELLFGFLESMVEVNMNTFMIENHQIVAENIISVMSSDLDSITYDNAIISKNKDVYTFNGISILGSTLNSMVEDANLPIKNLKIQKIDFNNRTIDVEVDGKVETFKLKEGITFEMFKFDSNQYKLHETIVDKVLETKARTLFSALNKILLNYDLSFEQIFKTSIDDAVLNINSYEKLDEIVNHINKEFNASKYVFGILYQINDYNISEIKDLKYELGKIILNIDPEFKFTEISNIRTLSNSDTLKVHDFWVTLEAEKKHFRLTSKDGGPWSLSEVSEEVTLFDEKRSDESESTLDSLKSDFELFINSTEFSSFASNQIESMQQIINESIALVLNGDMISDEIYDQIDEISNELEESENPNDIALLESFNSIISEINDIAFSNEAANNTTCPTP